ncbi:hypothetical protein ABIE13_003601 [Ottowia thiooxydans]|uniref:Uncharacterized protein n=1 Tax=Ottowia thiooxydans TaxID=219182 RepID=A0ABV2QBV4_9BURK
MPLKWPLLAAGNQRRAPIAPVARSRPVARNPLSSTTLELRPCTQTPHAPEMAPAGRRKSTPGANCKAHDERTIRCAMEFPSYCSNNRTMISILFHYWFFVNEPGHQNPKPCRSAKNGFNYLVRSCRSYALGPRGTMSPGLVVEAPCLRNGPSKHGAQPGPGRRFQRWLLVAVGSSGEKRSNTTLPRWSCSDSTPFRWTFTMLISKRSRPSLPGTLTIIPA